MSAAENLAPDPMTKALGLASRAALAVLPVRSDGTKRPAGGLSVYDATTDPQRIVDLWTDHPGSLVGVACGASGLLVVDIDRHEGGADGFASLDAARVALPETWQHASLSGRGAHLVYAAPSGGAAGGQPHPGVDLKGDGGYVVWTGGVPDSRDAFAPAPEWTLAPRREGVAGSDSERVAAWLAKHTGQPSATLADALAALPSHGSTEWNNANLLALALPLVQASQWSLGGAAARAEFAARYSAGTWHSPENERAALRAFDRALARLDYPSAFAAVPAVEATFIDMADTAPVPTAPTHSAPFQILSRADLKALPRPEWLVDGLVQESGIIVLAGEGGLGKSFLAIDWACRLATGERWFGRKVKHGKVLYVAGEGVEFFDDRLTAWEEHHGLRVPDDRLQYVCDGFTLSDPAAVEHMRQVVAAHGFDLVILDTLSQLAEVENENDNAQLAAVLRQARAIRQARPGCSVLIVHHTNKGERAKVRGASAIRSNADAVIVARSADGDTFKLSTKVEHDGKQKNGPAEVLTGFHLLDSGLSAVIAKDHGADPDIEAIEKVLAVPGEHPIAEFLIVRGENDSATSQRIKRRLGALVEEGRAVASGSTSARRWATT
ncbi:AAA family ATPase [Microbacterium sp. NPDC087589]|uniref:AAA family ATPase n=1 Tax=Microbacterium sp. NPDC087589 TaxID=3364191 RepID=UPI0038070EB6